MSGYLQYIVEEVLRDIPGISFRGMFGGYSLYKDGVIFGMIIDDQLYFKVDESNKPDFIEKECQPFLYTNKNGKEISMGYYTVPEEVLEDTNELQTWVEKAVQAKKNIKSKKK